MLLRATATAKASRAAVSLSELVSSRVGPSISEPTAMMAALGNRALQLLALPGQRLPLAVQQLDHRLEIGILRLNFLGALTVAVDLFAAEEEVVALALPLSRGDAGLESGDLFVDFLETLGVLARLGAPLTRPSGTLPPLGGESGIRRGRRRCARHRQSRLHALDLIGVVAGVDLRRAAVDDDHIVDHAVDEIAVVRDDDQRAGEALQRFFQCFARVN